MLRACKVCGVSVEHRGSFTIYEEPPHNMCQELGRGVVSEPPSHILLNKTPFLSSKLLGMA